MNGVPYRERAKCQEVPLLCRIALAMVDVDSRNPFVADGRYEQNNQGGKHFTKLDAPLSTVE